MTPRKEPWTFDEVSVSFVAKAANYITSRYGRYVERADVHSEMIVWLYGNKAAVEEWLALSPQRTTKVYRRLLDAGIAYAENEKAEKSGYKVGDLFFFSATMVKDLMPDVLNASYTRPNGAMDERLAAVLDIRRVLSDEERFYFLNEDDDHPLYSKMARSVAERLNGTAGTAGRRAISNAQAQAMTREQS